VGTAAARKAWLGTLALFLIHGLVVAAWISRIPGVQISLGLSNAALGLSLLGMALGSVTAIPIAGALINRYGSRRVSTLSTYAFCLALNAPGLGWNGFTLFLGLVVLGATAGTMDVAMNAQGVLVEKHLHQSSMSRFHGLFSLGAMIGAMVGGIVASHHISVQRHFLIASIVLLVCSIPSTGALLDSPEHESRGHESHRLPLSKMPRVIWALSGIAFCVLLSEGAMADWTAVYLRQRFEVGPATAAIGYAVFSATMAFCRLIGDHVTMRLGNVRTVRNGSLIGAFGLAIAILAPSVSWAMPGFAAIGIGFSIIVPLVFGAAGRVRHVSPGAGIATVTGLGYVGFLIGPPLLGFVSQFVTLRGSLGLVLALCLIAASLAGFLREAQPAPGAWNETSPFV